jgi:predicted lipoprotein with Yx(FWY)xxD motif
MPMLGITRTRTLVLGGVAGSAILLSACGSSSSGSTTQDVAAPPASTSASTVPTVLSVASSGLGKLLVDPAGKTVYLFASDTAGTSTCSGPCLAAWPAVPAPAGLPTSLPGVTGAVGSLTRTDGTSQLTVNGLPVYTFKGDSGPGTTKGQGLTAFGALWSAVSPSGTGITGTGSGASTAPATSGSGSNGY